MKIRLAQNKDTGRIIKLLSQVLEIHVAIRPDIFTPGTTKYSDADLAAIFVQENRRTYVAVDENDAVLGYAFCQIKDFSTMPYMVPHKELYIDDLCVDAGARNQGVGKALFAYVKEQAKVLGCRDITLNVWEGNAGAKAFYAAMGMQAKSTAMEMTIE